ncbi:AbrB/MazE/SpoVT family DNA-binding domain-containing protein [Bacillus cereus group sp. TH152-1LC]|uniref:AbrB/MazE/SpoVT family DNA-binding domain-containing protein n=1 Tax=Bacillus cereus group sp. TH152-1LC TaxID=3018060 RepID=UPI0022E2E176|nr:AbrB/MazE/SpoVT family DNA-binding domain-containing protein [Bacillus cereus group sp. TH152-1LC]MDA1675445.1 AbrB/MazE/SpoVT family DNA-binding domain-containing protein [Bacillus cereus group sp. TH152-1LC]
MEIKRKLRRVGNAMGGITLPQDMLKRMNLGEGDYVYISYENGAIVIRSQPKQSQSEDNEFREKVISIIDEYMDK